jgi:hypothetical protein
MCHKLEPLKRKVLVFNKPSIKYIIWFTWKQTKSEISQKKSFVILIFFLHVCWHKKNIWAYYFFRKYRLKTIYSGTNFSSFLGFRFYHSSVNFCDRTNCLDSLENKNKKNNNNNVFLSYLGLLKMKLPKITYF